MAAARSLGTTGVQLADSGDCVSAIPKLDAAEKLFHAPTTLERLGECEIKVGRLVAGTEHLNHVVREPLPPSPPPAFVSARARAQAALGPALPRIGKLRIHVDGVPADKVTVTVDGAPVPSVALRLRPPDRSRHARSEGGRDRLPGNDVQRDAEGRRVGERLAQARSGPQRRRGAPPPAGAATGTATGPAAPASPAPASGGGGGKGLAIGSLAVGGLGVVVGSVFGVMALSSKSSLDSACHTKSTCPSSSQSDINSLSSNATVSTIGFGVGIVGVALGAILLATSHGSDSQTTPSPAAAAPRVTPWVGFGAAGVEGHVRMKRFALTGAVMQRHSSRARVAP